MNKIIVISIMAMFLLFLIGCGKEETPSPTEPTAAESSTVAGANEAISNADKSLEDLEDAETDKELDDLGSVLEQI